MHYRLEKEAYEARAELGGGVAECLEVIEQKAGDRHDLLSVWQTFNKY